MVPGEGPQPSLGMIVGEAPGRTEVEQGRPFVGQAGKMLEALLRSLGVDRRGVYITNVVKEIPLTSDDKIRSPFPEEIAEWAPILEGEILQTAPAAILALGRIATDALTGLKTDERVPFGSKIGNVYTAWHPAFILRNRSPERQQEWRDQILPWAEHVGRFE